MNNIKETYKPGDLPEGVLPFFSSMVRAGTPTFGEDYIENTVDLNRLLVKNPEATFFVIAKGNSMNYTGIHDGDILIVDRSLEANTGNIVISTDNEELTIVPVKDNANREKIWGVVTHVIHKL